MAQLERRQDAYLAIGILSEPTKREYFDRREQIRASWLPLCRAALGCAAAFIFGDPPTRTADLSDAVVVTASEHPTVTTIAKTLGWFRFAVRRHQSLRFIAVVDDDTLVNPMGMLRDLRHNSQTHLWGAIEYASYDVMGLDMPVWADNQRGAMRRHALETLRRRETGEPVSSLQDQVRRASLQKLASTLRNRTEAARALRGPYPFAKGPAFVISAHLVRALLSSGCVQRLDSQMHGRTAAAAARGTAR